MEDGFSDWWVLWDVTRGHPSPDPPGLGLQVGPVKGFGNI